MSKFRLPRKEKKKLKKYVYTRPCVGKTWCIQFEYDNMKAGRP